MIYSDSWTEGLTSREQNIVIDYVLNECQLYDGIGGELTKGKAKRFLESEKGRKAVRLYAEFFTDTRRDYIKAKLVKLHFIRAFFNPADIIDAQGKFVIEDEKDLHKLGNLSYCIEGIKTEITGYNEKIGEPIKKIEIKLCSRDKSLEFLSKMFNIFDDEKSSSELIGEKSVYEMSDDERNAEIARLLAKDPEFAKKLLPENSEVNIEDNEDLK
jgi:hypothetical protein